MRAAWVLALLALGALGCGSDDARSKSGAQAVVRWEARQEAGVYGYLVYRSERREGPFVRVNAEIVHAAPEPAAGSREYSWIDREVTPGKTYYYYLDYIGVDGRKHRFSDVLSKAVAPAGER